MNEQLNFFDTVEDVVEPENIEVVADTAVTKKGKYEINDSGIVLNPENKLFEKGRARLEITYAVIDGNVLVGRHANTRNGGASWGVSVNKSVKYKSVSEAITGEVKSAIKWFKGIDKNSCASQVERRESRGMIKLLEKYVAQPELNEKVLEQALVDIDEKELSIKPSLAIIPVGKNTDFKKCIKKLVKEGYTVSRKKENGQLIQTFKRKK